MTTFLKHVLALAPMAAVSVGHADQIEEIDSSAALCQMGKFYCELGVILTGLSTCSHLPSCLWYTKRVSIVYQKQDGRIL